MKDMDPRPEQKDRALDGDRPVSEPTHLLRGWDTAAQHTLSLSFLNYNMWMTVSPSQGTYNPWSEE